MTIDQIITNIESSEYIPEEPGELKFETPWQARIFSLVVALYHDGVFEWHEFQSRLIQQIQDSQIEDDSLSLESVHYRQWVGAFTKLLIDKELCDPDKIELRTAEFKHGERDASEFVVDSINGEDGP